MILSLEVKTGYKTAIGHLFGGAFLLYIFIGGEYETGIYFGNQRGEG